MKQNQAEPLQSMNSTNHQQFETMIDNNTLYTQYKPALTNSNQQHLHSNEPNLISTSSASSTSTASCSSASSSSSSSALPNSTHNPPPPSTTRPYFANRDSLFYHSTDNYRYNVPVLNHTELQLHNQQKKMLAQQHQHQQHVSRIQSNKSQRQPQYNGHDIKHSTPVNVSNQVHNICDMFEEDRNNQFYANQNNFNRAGRNQLSTKSNPPTQSEFVLGNLPHQNSCVMPKAETIIEDEYFHRSFKQNFNQNFQNTKLNFNLHTPVIIPHPAQV